MYRTLLATVVLAAAAPAFAAPADDATFRAIEDHWAAANVAGDQTTLKSIIAADWTGQGDNGKLMTRDAFLAELKSGKQKFAKITNHDVHARVMGDVAVVQGADDETSSYDGKDTSGTYTWTDIYQKRGGQWVAVAGQYSEVKKH